MSGVQPLPRERCWQLFGLSITSPHRFVNRLAPGERAPDLWFRPVEEDPIDPAWTGATPGYRSPIMIDDQQHFLDVVVAPEATVFHFSEVVDFFVLADGIAYRLHDEAYAYMVELHFLGFVMSYWLERQGWPALHASAVVVDDRGVGFLSNHGGGKTSLAATLLRAGHALLSDDVLALRPGGGAVVGRPGYPQMRMWPDQARHFVGHDDLELVHPLLTKRRVPIDDGGFGCFDGSHRPVAALYVPERHDGGDIVISDMAPGEAVFALARHSFLTGIVEGIGLAPSRFETLSRIVRQVPVRTLRYPNGLELLPKVVDHVLADVRATT